MFSELLQLADIVRSAFHYSAYLLYCRSLHSGSEQFHAELAKNATRLSRIDWLWSAKRASVWVTGGRRRVKQENPPMRIYIIGNDGITLCREAPATVNEGEIAVASNEELHAAPLSGKRLLALWNALPGVEKRKKVGDRGALIDQLRSAIEALPPSDAKRPSTQELRLAWREFHRAGPPLGLSRDPMIRALAYELQQRAHGGASAALRRRLQSLAGASEKGALADPGILLKAGTTLVRQWRGQTHTVLVDKDGF